jgi:subtilisin family serine protease
VSTHTTLAVCSALCGLMLTAGSAVAGDSDIREGLPPAAFEFIDDDPVTSKVYIVQLREPAAASAFAMQHAAVSGKISAPQAFDKNSNFVRSYTQKLANEQQAVLAKAGPGTEQIYSYRYSLNGFAARMSPAQAQRLGSLPEVAEVWEDEIRPLTTNHSAEFLGLFDNEAGLRGKPGLDGDGIVIGVIDSGIAPEHPALRDTREAPQPKLCSSTWGKTSLLGRWLCRRFRRLPDIVFFNPPEDWNGSCQAGPEFEASLCNNKLIGARYFFDGAQNSGPIDDGEIFSARDVDGHGTHTATTAAGNRVDASIFGSFIGRVEGMAPRARIAAYKACWLRPGATRSSCNTSDLALAIDTAVADGVDIINYSVGNSLREVTAPDDLALMAAAKAGVLTIVAAGNEGPGFATVGSPAGAPWVMTAAASSRDGEHSLEALRVSSPASLAGRYAVREANFTAALADNDPIEEDLVLVDDEDDTLPGGAGGTTFDACSAIANSSEVNGKIAYLQRGGCSFLVKLQNARDAGAAAALVFNVAGDPIVMTTDTSSTVDIPALMIGQADGNRILDEINAGETVRVVLDKGLLLAVSDDGNVMGSFSSRGPAPIQDILKPDVTAPGINILAGFTPDAINSVKGENFAYLTGTSMATPHVTGVAALLRQAHPDWSPAAIKSALMTTAYQEVTQPDGETPAIPFDMGAGHIQPNSALDPGLVYDAGDDDYDAFACAIRSPAVSQARCDELRAGGMSLDPSDMNQPSIAVARLANTQTVVRRVTNVSEDAANYTAVVVAPAGITTSVSPQSLSLSAGETASFEVTYTYQSGAMNSWRFGSLTWESEDYSVRSVLAVRPVSLTAPAEVASFGGTGSLTFPVEFGYNGSYNARVHGMERASGFRGSVAQDPDKTFDRRDVGNGAFVHSFLVPADQLYLRFALFDELTDGNDDLDMYVYFCPEGSSFCSRIGESGNETSREQFNLVLPGAGTYQVYVHGFATDDVSGGPGAVYDLLAWQLGINEDVGNMTVTAPTVVSAGTTETVQVDWNNLASGTVHLGAISHNTPTGLVSITVIAIQN